MLPAGPDDRAQSADSCCAPILTRHGAIQLARRTAVMGILNVTPDSFYDGGHRPNADKAVADAMAMVEAGADIIDIGGESTRPGASPVPLDEELARVLPIIRPLRRLTQLPISIDTYKSGIAKVALAEGADIVNDISALTFDSGMVDLVAAEKVPVVLMHMQGTPRTMQHAPDYGDVVAEVRDYLARRVEFAVARGVERDKIIIDPGIGFGKTLEHNLALLRGLPALARVGQPLLVGVSRKGFIGKLLDAVPGKRLEGSLAAAVAVVLAGAHVIRVHDVKATRKAIRVADAIRFGVSE
ncbi:MAG: dihydropteroate synthase [Alphaproteobacteria bacterium]